MKEIGKILKQARENKKITFEEIHKKLKIKEAYIIALENDDVSAFPAELYYKNFLRSYAKFLNLKPEEFIKDYEQARIEEQKKEIKQQEETAVVKYRLQKKMVLTLIFAAVMFVFLIAFEFLLKQQSKKENEKYTAAAAVAVSTYTVNAAEVAVSSSQVVLQTPAVPVKQKLVIKAGGKTWISVFADNKKAFEGTITSGESKEFIADGVFVLKMGNVLNAVVYFNDKKIDITAGAGKNNVNIITLKKPEASAIGK